ncbi:MAG: hypothetical protein E7411_04950 [Ruminococcaceae bacterium]|nr:hypothetical protein [Oscillospiraceae bacterium]
MKKIISIILTLTFLFSAFSIFAVNAAEEVIYEDGFEKGVVGWTIPSGRADHFFVTDEDAKSGKQSLKIIDDDDSKSYNYYAKKFKVKPGDEYTLSVDIKVLSGSATAGKVFMRFNDADGKSVYSKSTAGSGNKWIRREETHIAPEKADTGMVIISSQGAGIGEALIDNLCVTKGAANVENVGSGNGADEIKDYKSEALKKLKASEPINLGAPISDIQIMGNYVDVRDNGDVIFYGVVSGPPAILFAYDVNTGEILDTELLQNEDGSIKARLSYGVDMDSEGVLNIPSNTLFFRYDTKTGTLKNYGRVFSETGVPDKGYVDSEDNYFFGTYPNAKLVKYDKKQDKLIDLGTMIPTGKYVRCMGGYKDKIFMGGMGNPTTEWVKYDIKSGTRTVLKNPSLEGKFEEKDVENFYACSTAGKYLFARCKISSLGMYYLCVFDMEKEEWIDYIEKTSHLHLSPFEGDVVYYHNNIDGGPGLFSYNPVTKEKVRLEGFDIPEIDTYIIMPKIATLKNQEKYPGRTMIAGGNTNGIVLVNFEKKTVEYIKDSLPANSTNIRTIKAGLEGEIVVSAYMGAKFVSYDIEKQKNKYEVKGMQYESIAVIDGKYYFGHYGREAGLCEFDTATKNTPTTIAKMDGADQDRAFNIVDAGDKIVWGSFPDYGRLGGAVSVYDKASKKVTGIYKEPVKNQCIAGLAYRNGKIYGSTSIYGGLGIDPVDAPAQMFIMDPETGKVEKSVEVKLTTDKNSQYFVGNMLFDDEGNLWVACAQTLLKVNPDTLEIEKEIPIGSRKHSLSKTWALPYSLEIGKDGLMYTNIGNQVSAVDLKTYEVKTLFGKGTNVLTVGSDGNIYMVGYDNINNLHKIEITRGGKYDDITNNGISLFVGTPNALVKGEKTLINKSNDKVIATIVNSRTLVPVRFIAENFGAEVGWDDATRTVTLTLKDKTVKIVLDKAEIDINGAVTTIDVPAQSIEGRTMLPLRAFVENVMGKKIFWDARGLIVITDTDVLDAEADKAVIDSLVEKIK